MNRSIFAIIAVLLLSVPAAFATDSYYYPGDGKSYESYSRTYDTVQSQTQSNSNSASGYYNNGAAQSYGFPYSPSQWNYGGWYQYPNNYYYGSFGSSPNAGNSQSWSSSSSSSSANTYSEKTNEVIKVDRYIAYDNSGIIRLTSGDSNTRHPYYYDYSTDNYALRYPYSGMSTGDNGYYSQPYYANAYPTEVVVRIPDYSSNNMVVGSAQISDLRRSVPLNQYVSSVSTVSPSEDGPSQTYSNRITDRGPLYVPISCNMSCSLDAYGSARNKLDTSSYQDTVQRDAVYVYIYGEDKR